MAPYIIVVFTHTPYTKVVIALVSNTSTCMFIINFGSSKVTEHCPLAAYLNIGCGSTTYFHFVWIEESSRRDTVE